MGRAGTIKVSAAETTREPDFFSHQITEARRFFLELQPSVRRPLVVVGGGSERCAADYHIKRADFPYYAVEFVARGEGKLRLGAGAAGAALPLTAGTIFAYGPEVAQDIRSSGHRPLEKYFVTFTGGEARRWLGGLGGTALRAGEMAQSSAPEHILRIFEELIEAGRRETPYRPRICRTILEHLLQRMAETAVPVGTIGTEAFEAYQRCRGWMERNYLRAGGLAEIAESCGLDGAYICRLFKRFDHQSPWQFVLRLKMRDAAQRLQTERVLISEVAEEFGFGDAFGFSRTFRRIFGVSPRKFVELQRRHA